MCCPLKITSFAGTLVVPDKVSSIRRRISAKMMWPGKSAANSLENGRILCGNSVGLGLSRVKPVWNAANRFSGNLFFGRMSSAENDAATAQMGQMLLQGWTMMAESCPLGCHVWNHPTKIEHLRFHWCKRRKTIQSSVWSVNQSSLFLQMILWVHNYNKHYHLHQHHLNHLNNHQHLHRHPQINQDQLHHPRLRQPQMDRSISLLKLWRENWKPVAENWKRWQMFHFDWRGFKSSQIPSAASPNQFAVWTKSVKCHRLHELISLNFWFSCICYRFLCLPRFFQQVSMPLMILIHWLREWSSKSMCWWSQTHRWGVNLKLGKPDEVRHSMSMMSKRWGMCMDDLCMRMEWHRWWNPWRNLWWQFARTMTHVDERWCMECDSM